MANDFDVYILKQDETNAYIYADDKILREFERVFKFRPDNWRFSPAYRNGFWDGWIHLFRADNNLMPLGLVPRLLTYCDMKKYRVKMSRKLIPKKKVSYEELTKFVDKIVSKDAKVEKREYQIKSAAYIINRERVILVSPTASGKSFILYVIIRWLIENGLEKSILLLVPNNNLVVQMKKEFVDYAKGTGFDVESNCQLIYEGGEKEISKKIVISNWQSLCSKKGKMIVKGDWFNNFSALLGDEVHQFAADSLSKITKQLASTVYKAGVTGSMQDDQAGAMSIEGMFGPVIKFTTTKKLMEKGQLSKLKIHIVRIKYPDELAKAVFKLKKDEKYDFDQEIGLLVGLQRRNELITSLVKSRTSNTLVLFQLVKKHGKPLYEMIKLALAGTGRNVYFIYGGTELEKREKIRQAMESENGSVIVASFGVYSTGISIRNLQNLIYAHPPKKSTRVLQTIGRALRLDGKKNKANLFDLVDDFSYRGSKNFAMRHFDKRLKVYHREKHEYVVSEFTLKIPPGDKIYERIVSQA